MQPTLFRIGSIEISGYYFTMVLGFLVAAFVVFYFGVIKEKLKPLKVFSFIFLFIIVSVLGAKLYRVFYMLITEPGVFFEKPLAIFNESPPLVRILKAGGGFYGGFILSILFAAWYLKKIGLSFWPVMDITGMGAALGHSIGRVGCFLAGCCYGRPTDCFLAVKFPHLPVPVHPVQLYEFFLNLINFFFLLLIYNKKRFQGQVFAVYMMNYALIRFLTEYFRGDVTRGYLIRNDFFLLTLSVPQFISILVLIVGIVIYHKQRSQLLGKPEKIVPQPLS